MNKIINYIKLKIISNYKILIGILSFIIILILIFQIYSNSQENKVLRLSIEYNNSLINNSSEDFYTSMEKLSKNKNFYGILSTIQLINIDLKNNLFDKAAIRYNDLIDSSKLDIIYKSTIATHGAYSFLNLINKNNYIDISNKIDSLLLNIDESLVSFQGFKLEIKYLLSLIESTYGKQVNEDDILNLYNQVINNENVSSEIKDRLKKINEYYKYK